MSRDSLAMRYEYLMRRAFQCGRHGVAGANADIFRRLNHAEELYRTEKENERNGRPKQWLKSSDELYYEYASICGEVAAYIDTAIRKVLMDYAYKLNEEQKQILNACRTKLSHPSYETIENVLDTSEKIMVELKLFPQ